MFAVCNDRSHGWRAKSGRIPTSRRPAPASQRTVYPAPSLIGTDHEPNPGGRAPGEHLGGLGGLIHHSPARLLGPRLPRTGPHPQRAGHHFSRARAAAYGQPVGSRGEDLTHRRDHHPRPPSPLQTPSLRSRSMTGETFPENPVPRVSMAATPSCPQTTDPSCTIRPSHVRANEWPRTRIDQHTQELP